MKLSALLMGMILLIAAAHVYGYQPDEGKALDVARSALDRAISVGDASVVPEEALRTASLGQVYVIHHPETLEPLYSLVPIRSTTGDVIGIIGVDARSERVLWYNFHYARKAFPPVTASQAEGQVQARARMLGEDGEEDGELAAPVLIRG